MKAPILLLACLASCVANPELSQRRHAITGGSPEAGYPSVFALAYNGQGGCSGTCIAPNVGLTAAHCVEGEPANVLSALFGPTEYSVERQIQVTEVLAHPEYDSGSRSADIALLRFAEACPAVTPYNPHALEPFVGQGVTMVGFGVTTEDADDAGIKRSGVATLFSVTPSQVSGMTEGELATSNDPHGTCNGDSGGPTFMTMEGTEYVVGVTSRGSTGVNGVDEPCGQGRSIATRADSFSDWILEFMGEAPGEGGGNDTPGDETPGDETPGQPDSETPAQDVGGCQTGHSKTGGMAFLLLAVLLRRRRVA